MDEGWGGLQDDADLDIEGSVEPEAGGSPHSPPPNSDQPSGMQHSDSQYRGLMCCA